jgi:ABC-2 type transport system permease protein
MSTMIALFKRELKSYFESPVAYVFLVVFLLLSGFLTFFVEHFYEMGQATLERFFIWQPVVYLLLVPAASMRMWSEERRSGTIELLLTLPVTMSQAILAKFLAAWVFLILAILLTCPVIFTVYMLGDPDTGAIITGYLGCMLLAGAYLAVGTVTSAMTRNQVISFVISLVVCLFLFMAGWPPVMEMLVKWAPNWLVNGVASFSVTPHFESMQRGVLDLRDFVYYFSVIGVMLFAAYLVIENRKSA